MRFTKALSQVLFLSILFSISIQAQEAEDFSKELEDAQVTYKNQVITVTTGKVKRSWEWNAKGFHTTSYRNLHSGTQWCQATPSYPADWDLSAKI